MPHPSVEFLPDSPAGGAPSSRKGGEQGRHPHPTRATPPGELKRKNARSRGVRRALTMLGILVVAGALFGVAVAVPRGNGILKNFGNSNLWEELFHLSPSAPKELAGEREDRINVLLLGIGGEGHEGAYLADTVILLSVRPSTGETALISLPRDLVVPFPPPAGGGEVRKINALSAVGEELQGSGGEYARATLARVFNIPIHFWARIDFSGFAKIVDDLGGIIVDVERPFVDREYPTERFGVTTIAFAAGTQALDGKRALQYVRSRHGTNGEGSDFARARRQQKVLLAIQEKLLSRGMLLAPQRVFATLADLGSHIETNLAPWQLLRLAELARARVGSSSSRGGGEHITHFVFENDGVYLKSETGVDGAYVLVPVGGTYDDIAFVIAKIFLVTKAKTEGTTVALSTPSQSKSLYERWKNRLSALGFAVNAGPPLKENPLPAQSVVYDLSGGLKRASRALLLERVGGIAQEANPSLLGEIATSPPPDFLVVLGENVLTLQTSRKAIKAVEL